MAILTFGRTIVITITNGKGGSGKTPTAIQLAFALAVAGYKVLFCDLDQQGTASFHLLGFKFKIQTPTIYHALKDVKRIDPIVISPNFHLLPANAELEELEVSLTVKRGLFWQGRLTEVLALYGDEYNVVICDTPGSAVSIFPTMTLTSADLAILPVKTEIAFVVGTSDTVNLIEDVQGGLNKTLTAWGILPCQYETTTGHHRDSLSLIGELYGKKGMYIYPEPSRKTTLYNEATEQHIDIRHTDSRQGPHLGAYWDRIAENVMAKAAEKVKAR